MSDYYKFKPGVKFTKDFDGKVLHWEDWSFNITIALVPLGLQGVMEGVEPRPSPLQAPQVFPAPPPNVGNAQDNAGGAQPQPQQVDPAVAAAAATREREIAAWDKKNNLVFSILASHVKGDPLSLVRQFRTTLDGAAAWKALKDKYEDTGVVGEVELISKLFACFLADDQDPDSFFAKIEELCGRIQVQFDSVEKLVNAFKLGVLLTKSPTKYEPLVTALTAQRDLDYDKSKDQFRTFYMRQMAKDRAADDPARALWSNGGRGAPGGKPRGKPRPTPSLSSVVCHYKPCGKPGHVSYKCPLRTQHLAEGKKIQCQACGRTRDDHAADCRFNVKPKARDVPILLTLVSDPVVADASVTSDILDAQLKGYKT